MKALEKGNPLKIVYGYCLLLACVPMLAGCAAVDSRGTKELQEIRSYVNSFSTFQLMESKRYPVPKGLCMSLLNNLKSSSLTTEKKNE